MLTHVSVGRFDGLGVLDFPLATPLGLEFSRKPFLAGARNINPKHLGLCYQLGIERDIGGFALNRCVLIHEYDICASILSIKCNQFSS